VQWGGSDAEGAFDVPFIGDVPMQGLGRKPQQPRQAFALAERVLTSSVS